VSESVDEHENGEDDAAEVEEVEGALADMLETIRQAKVAPLILSTVSTFASVAYGKLDAKDLPEAKTAIDVIDALLPLLTDEVDQDIVRDFAQALTNLKLAYADAVASAE
jgi:hypothetical protein